MRKGGGGWTGGWVREPTAFGAFHYSPGPTFSVVGGPIRPRPNDPQPGPQSDLLDRLYSQQSFMHSKSFVCFMLRRAHHRLYYFLRYISSLWHTPPAPTAAGSVARQRSVPDMIRIALPGKAALVPFPVLKAGTVLCCASSVMRLRRWAKWPGGGRASRRHPVARLLAAERRLVHVGGRSLPSPLGSVCVRAVVDCWRSGHMMRMCCWRPEGSERRATNCPGTS